MSPDQKAKYTLCSILTEAGLSTRHSIWEDNRLRQQNLPASQI